MPAQKKHSSVRRRANKAPTAAVLEHPEEGDEYEVPDLPKRFIAVTLDDGTNFRREVEWCPETVEWWEDVWASPMASEYLDADLHGLVRLAALVDNYWLDPSAKTHAEVRLAQKDYGLTPYDRRRLEWTIEEAEEKQARGARRRSAQAPVNPQGTTPGSDPRLKLVPSTSSA